MTILAAKTEKVPFGFFVIDGLMDEQGNYYVGVPQIATLVSLSNAHASRDFKALLLKDSSLTKPFSDYVKLKSDLNSQPVNAITLHQFEFLLAKLDRKGNVKAQELRDSLVGLSLHQLFSDAFDKKFEKEERQDWLRKRAFTKETFWFMTAAIDKYYQAHPRVEKYKGQNYSEVFDCLNKALFGLKSKDIKQCLGIGQSQLNRDHFGRESLIKIEMVQRIAEAQMAYHTKTPLEAVKTAINMMNYQVSDFKE
jgi:hypothetical protein